MTTTARLPRDTNKLKAALVEPPRMIVDAIVIRALGTARTTKNIPWRMNVSNVRPMTDPTASLTPAGGRTGGTSGAGSHWTPVAQPIVGGSDGASSAEGSAPSVRPVAGSVGSVGSVGFAPEPGS